MNLLEKDLEDLIHHQVKYNKNAIQAFHEKGLQLKRSICVFRQLRLKSGVADLVFLNSCTIHEKSNTLIIGLEVWELKKDMVSMSTLSQASLYGLEIRKQIESTVSELSIDKKIPEFENIEFNIGLVLIGKEISDDLAAYTTIGLTGIKVYQYLVDFQKGLLFQEHNQHFDFQFSNGSEYPTFIENKKVGMDVINKIIKSTTIHKG